MTHPQPELPIWLNTDQRRLIGRRSELETLNEGWERASDSRGQLVLLSGDAGIGKSKLVSELAVAAHEAGAVVLAGSCEKDHPKPFQPFVDALAPLEALLPELAVDTDQEVSGLLASSSESREIGVPRHRLFDSVLRLLEAIGADLPTVLIIEDLHWAADPTLELLGHVSRYGSSLRLLTLGTFRTAEVRERPALGTMLTEIYRHAGVTRIDLEGLSVEEIVRFLMTETGATKSEVVGTATSLRDLTGGNPFYLHELWETRPDTKPWIDGEQLPWKVPRTISDAVRTRLEIVDPSTVETLICASVTGVHPDPDLIAEIRSTEVGHVRTAFDDAIGHGLMGCQTNGSYYFVHDLTRQAMLEEMSPSELAKMHERIAHALEARHGDDPTQAATLAFHYSRAIGKDEEAERHFARAGEHAQRALAYEEAAEHFKSAASHAGDPVAADRMAIRAAENLLKAGRFSAAAKLYDRADASDDADIRARAAIGVVEATWRPGRFGHEAAARLISVRQALGAIESSDVGVEVRCYLALALGYAGAHDAAEKVGQAALADARELGDVRLEAKALLYPKMTSPDLNTELYERVKKAHRLVVEAGDLDLLGQAAYMTGALGYVMADPEAWTNALSDLVEVVEGTDQPFHRLALQGSLCARAFSRGDYEQALGYADAFSEMAGVFGEDPVDGLDGAQRFMIERETGLDGIRPLIKGAPEQEVGSWRLGLLALYSELDMTDPLATVLDELMASSMPDEAAGRYQGAKAAFLTEAIFNLRHRGYAEQMYAVLEERQGTNLVWGHFVMVFGSADRYLGMLADVLDRDATGHFEAALEVDTTMRATQHRAETLARYAQHASGRDDDRARRLAAEAADLGRLMGSSRIERVARLDPTRRPDGLTGRELEVLRLVADGYSNREIAEELYISLNTATNHVRSILIKTGCNNRTQAARYALDAKLIRR